MARKKTAGISKDQTTINQFFKTQDKSLGLHETLYETKVRPDLKTTDETITPSHGSTKPPFKGLIQDFGNKLPQGSLKTRNETVSGVKSANKTRVVIEIDSDHEFKTKDGRSDPHLQTHGLSRTSGGRATKSSQNSRKTTSDFKTTEEVNDARHRNNSLELNSFGKRVRTSFEEDAEASQDRTKSRLQARSQNETVHQTKTEIEHTSGLHGLTVLPENLNADETELVKLSDDYESEDEDFEDVDILTHLVQLAWTCISITGRNKSYVWDRIFPSTDAVDTTLRSLSWSFAPGLTDLFANGKTPDIAFFRSTPTEDVKKWGVYVLLLEHPASDHFRVYVGSGTSATRGIRGRLAQHGNDSRWAVPLNVKKSIGEGWKVTHKGLLAWIALPSPEDRPLRRVAVVLLEAVFTFALWAIRAQTTAWDKFKQLCTFDTNLVLYDGLCSHNPLMEVSGGELDMSPDELIEAANQQRLALRALFRTEPYRAKRRVNARKRWRTHAERLRAQARARNKEIIAEGTHYCKLCDIAFSRAAALTRHEETSQSHLRAGETGKVDKPTTSESVRAYNRDLAARNRATGRYRCDLCDANLQEASALKTHLKGKRHLAKEAAALAAASNNT